MVIRQGSWDAMVKGLNDYQDLKGKRWMASLLASIHNIYNFQTIKLSWNLALICQRLQNNCTTTIFHVWHGYVTGHAKGLLLRWNCVYFFHVLSRLWKTEWPSYHLTQCCTCLCICNKKILKTGWYLHVKQLHLFLFIISIGKQPSFVGYCQLKLLFQSYTVITKIYTIFQEK